MPLASDGRYWIPVFGFAETGMTPGGCPLSTVTRARATSPRPGAHWQPRWERRGPSGRGGGSVQPSNVTSGNVDWAPDLRFATSGVTPVGRRGMALTWQLRDGGANEQASPTLPVIPAKAGTTPGGCPLSTVTPGKGDKPATRGPLATSVGAEGPKRTRRRQRPTSPCHMRKRGLGPGSSLRDVRGDACGEVRHGACVAIREWGRKRTGPHTLPVIPAKAGMTPRGCTPLHRHPGQGPKARDPGPIGNLGGSEKGRAVAEAAASHHPVSHAETWIGPRIFASLRPG